MQSWELLSELFISLRASLKNISEGARETPAASAPACSPQRLCPLGRRAAPGDPACRDGTISEVPSGGNATAGKAPVQFVGTRG